VRHFFLELETGEIPAVGQIVTLDQEESHHLGTVLRGGRDQEVALTDGRGNRFVAGVSRRDRRQAHLEILSMQRDDDEFAAPRLVLGMAMVKVKRFEWALEKAVELGVHRISPLITEHSVVEPGKEKSKRWRTIMKSAVKQCGRSFLPGLDEVVQLKQFLQNSKAGLTVFGAVPGEQGLDEPAVTLLDLAARQPGQLPPQITALIGPEGGWSEQEVSLFQESGLQPVNLGPHILRAETAAAACLAGLQGVRQGWLGNSAIRSPGA
jgi:16S rRNA (uracil1498-N3)-methyltransferase